MIKFCSRFEITDIHGLLFLAFALSGIIALMI